MQSLDSEFLTKYFRNGLENENRAIAHSILFYGSDVRKQYNLAYEVARLLNCKEGAKDDCHCINCNWIRDFQHPAVLTISKSDNKPEDDDSKTVISIKQSQMIKSMLATTSEFHRVFIFCDRDEDGEPQGLNEKNFQEEVANSLLKVIEEPPENTTFFFLTRNKNDLISTIISRSQCFFVPSMIEIERGFELVEDIVENYWELNRDDTFDFSEKIFIQSKVATPIKVLDEFENYILSVMKSNLDNSLLKLKFMDDLKTIENAKKMIYSKVNPQNVFDTMCLELTK